MLYINQNDYPHIPYPTNLDEPESPSCLEGTVASSGCGLCSLMMIVDRLTVSSLTLEDALRLSHESNADRKVGTNLKILGPVIAQKYGLCFTTTSDMERLLSHLQNGGAAIANVGGDHDDHIGVFSDVGHYITVLSYSDGELLILDPAYRLGKYTSPGREGKIRENGVFLYTSPEILLSDTENREPRFYLFSAK